MPTNTYAALDKVTVSSSPLSNITFTNISQNYTDLRVVIFARSTNTSTLANLYTYVNNDFSATNYSQTYMLGNGTTATSNKITSQGTFQWPQVPAASSTANIFGTITLDILNYSNNTTFKSNIFRSATDLSGSGNTIAGVGLWRSTAAINSIGMSVDGNFAVGTTISLYGIKAWTAESTPKATGGYVYSDSTYWYHAFPFSSTFTPNQSLTADILVVAGGGGGGGFTGGNGNGGGGAGGLLAYSSQSLTATSYTCTIGAGGAGGLTASGSTNGANSQFGALTASVGGGRGANGGSASNGSSVGGSGGGGQGSNDLNYVNGSAGTSGQGYSGGNGYNSGSTPGGGGGGGAGGAGATGGVAIGGTGGVGATSALINTIGSATGYGQLVSSNYYFAGGGAGSTSNSGSGTALGGYGGGGTGYYDGGPAGGAGVATLGGGGGAGRAANGGNGGSGIVVIRYAK